MRNTFSKTLYDCACNDPEIHVVVADISPAGSMADFQREHPNRFINVGVAEQVMIGMCAGLALKGCQAFAYTIAAFSLYRPFEMVRDDLAYQNLPVTVVGMGSGIVYSSLGGTHHTMEDVAIASSIPNMQVLAPCDPLECIEATKYCAGQKIGPIYLRIGKAGEPNLTDKAIDKFEFGKIRYLQKGNDVCIISYGPIMSKAVSVADKLAKKGFSSSIISCHTIKPLDTVGIIDALNSHEQVIVLEEHVPQGGLSSRVKQLAWDVRASCKLTCFTLKDEFIHMYGSYDELLSAHGITEDGIINSVS